MKLYTILKLWSADGCVVGAALGICVGSRLASRRRTVRGRFAIDATRRLCGSEVAGHSSEPVLLTIQRAIYERNKELPSQKVPRARMPRRPVAPRVRREGLAVAPIFSCSVFEVFLCEKLTI